MLSHHDLDEILGPSLDSTGSINYMSSPASDDQGYHSEADPDIPMYQHYNCKK